MSFGYSPYGVGNPFGSGLGPGGPYNAEDGYGEEGYGTSVYGSTEGSPPEISSATSLTGYTIEVFFSKPMKTTAASLLDPASYVVETIFGAAPSTISSVAISTYSTVDVYAGQTAQGVLSVILTHTGTTKGGIFRVRAIVGLLDLIGNPMIIPVNIPEDPLDPFNPDYIQCNEAVILAKGDPAAFSVTAVSGNTLLIQFAEDMVPEATVSPGIEQLAAYEFTPTPSYPVTLTPITVTHPYGGDASQALLAVQGMTSLPYTLKIAPAEAFDYDGTYLPDVATTFTGTEIGTGTSVASSSLSMAKLLHNSYGWSFTDTSGKVSATCSYAMGITIDVSAMSVFPALKDGTPLIEIVFDDGTNQIPIQLSRTAGADVITVVGLGSYSVTWSTGGSFTLWLYRNQQAGTYTVLRGDTPFVTTAIATFAGGGSFTGVSATLTTDYELSGFRIGGVDITATETVFSGSWNFLHEQIATFTGSGALTRRTLLTQRGPLVKGWGDATPASKEDVTVEVNGTAVEVGEVNPYIGQIKTLVPIPLMPMGGITVDVDYKWFYNPIMELEGLNTNGLVLNKWNRPLGHHYPPAHGEQVQTLPTFPKGAPDRMRFPMNVVLGPTERPEPLYIGHRFHALDRDYSATLNDPTLMLINQNPHSVAVPGLESIPEGETVSYEGLVVPTLDDSVWTLNGVDSGGVNVGLGTYTVTDALATDRVKPQPAHLTSTVNPPYDLTIPAMPWVTETRPLGIQISGIGSTASFTGAAANVESENDTWDFTGGKTLTLKVNRGVEQTVTFVDAVALGITYPISVSPLTITSVAHGLLEGSQISIAGTPDIDGVHVVLGPNTVPVGVITPNTFQIDSASVVGGVGTFSYSDFVTPTAATAEEVAVVVNATGTGAAAKIEKTVYTHLTKTLTDLNIASSTAATVPPTPAIITTAAPHGLTLGHFVTISNHVTAPVDELNGVRTVMAILSPTQFHVGIAVIGAGGGATGTITREDFILPSPDTNIVLYSDRKGTGSYIEVTGGTANAAGLLEFSTTEQQGTGNVSNLAAVTMAEVDSIIEAAVSGCTVETPLPFTLYTTGTGSSATLQVSSTAATILGLDTILHTGIDGSDTTAFYYRDIDLSFPSSTVCAARFKVDSVTTAHGVFSGVGFGVHNNHRMWVVGCLEINAVKHIGFLKDARNPQLQASWEIGPSISGTVTSTTTVTATTADLPIGTEAGDRFQLFTGGQAGVYTLATVVHQTDGTSTLTITGVFPANYKLWGNRDISMVFETVYSNTLSYQLTTSPEDGTATLYVSGALSGSFLTTTSASTFPDPAETGLMLDADGEGQVFWGSLSRDAVNSSTWNFFRYGIQPDQRMISGRGLVVASMMSEIPKADPNSVWFRTQGFGYDEIEGPTNRLLLKSGAASPNLDYTYGYGRIEPFLKPEINIDVDATFQMDSGTLGSGDLQIDIQNTKKRVLFSPIMYLEPSGSLLRRLFTTPEISASCLFLPSEESSAWSAYGSPTAEINIKTLTIDGSGGFGAEIDLTGMAFADHGGRILEARMAITSYTAATPTYAVLAANVGTVAVPKGLLLTWRESAGSPVVTLCSDISIPIYDYSFDWQDGESHTYRVVIDAAADSVLLIIDDVVYPPGVLSAFSAATNNVDMRFGVDQGTGVVTKWDYAHLHVTPPSDAKRTLGVWLGTDLDDIDYWEIPRTDSSSLPNSSSDAAVIIQEMDWRNEMDVRVHWDAGWGVTVFRPDLPPPPYFTGDFATDITEPSAGWINVETSKIPRQIGESFGSVKFGSLRNTSISQQRWQEVRYRLYNWPSKDFRSGEHMVLNQSNVITSGEPTLDTTPESVVVTSLDTKHLTLLPTRITADRVFSVVDNGTLISSSYYEFNKATQILSLVAATDGSEVSFSGEHVPVTVTFAPGKPYTKTYLEDQPLLDSTELLNEGTPPFFKHQAAPDVSTVAFGTQIYDPMGNLNDDPDFILNDPYRYVSFVEEGDALYTDLTAIEVDNDGSENLIQGICDEWAAIELSGDLFTEWQAPMPKEDFPQGAGMNLLIASGGNKPLGGTLGPGSAVLYAGVKNEITWAFNLSAVLIDATVPTEQALAETDVLNEYADEVPPIGHATDLLAPDGTVTIGGVPVVPPAHGEGGAYLTFAVDGDYAHLGPWGGMSALQPGAQEIIGPEVAGVAVGLPFTHSSILCGTNAVQPTGIPVGSGMILEGGSALPAGGTYSTAIDAAN
jgi:hypothetical protein